MFDSFSRTDSFGRFLAFYRWVPVSGLHYFRRWTVKSRLPARKAIETAEKGRVGAGSSLSYSRVAPLRVGCSLAIFTNGHYRALATNDSNRTIPFLSYGFGCKSHVWSHHNGMVSNLFIRDNQWGMLVVIQRKMLLKVVTKLMRRLIFSFINHVLTNYCGAILKIGQCSTEKKACWTLLHHHLLRSMYIFLAPLRPLVNLLNK